MANRFEGYRWWPKEDRSSWFDAPPPAPQITIHHVLTERIEVVELQPDMFEILQKYGSLQIRIIPPISFSSEPRKLSEMPHSIQITVTYTDFLNERIIESQS